MVKNNLEEAGKKLLRGNGKSSALLMAAEGPMQQITKSRYLGGFPIWILLWHFL